MAVPKKQIRCLIKVLQSLLKSALIVIHQGRGHLGQGNHGWRFRHRPQLLDHRAPLERRVLVLVEQAIGFGLEAFSRFPDSAGQRRGVQQRCLPFRLRACNQTLDQAFASEAAFMAFRRGQWLCPQW